MSDLRIHADADGVYLFDADLAPSVSHGWFDPAWWQAQGRLHGRGGGRGSVCFIDTPAGACVLRHYHRGGMVAAMLGDRYLWRGRESTRSFAEFRLTTRLAALGLPVPLPVAARYHRRGMYYQADLITRRIEAGETLAAQLAGSDVPATRLQRIGAVIARFHAAGVWHADLNAHNIISTPARDYLIDFDRGELRAPAASWQRGNLQRLRRSLLKLGAGDGDESRFEQACWVPLMRGYERAMQTR